MPRVRHVRLLALSRLVTELARVTRVAREAERLRMNVGPAEAVARQRAKGRRKRRRDAPTRQELRTAVNWLDAKWPGGGNCFRRVLIELALDAGAAEERLVFGLDVGKTGHVAFEGADDATFDVAFVLGPE